MILSSLVMLRRGLLLTLAVAVAGCIISSTIHVEPLRYGASDSAVVRNPVRAHLVDGSTVVFRRGVTVARNQLLGSGARFSAVARESTLVASVPLDSVIGMEAFRSQVNPGRTLGYSVLATGLVIAGSVAAICAADPKCFGSCPTFYTDSSGVPVLEAEGFSYSISPLLEARDVDRLRAQPSADGVLRVQVLNEALETHYINHLEILEASHEADEVVLPDQSGRPVAVRQYVIPLRITDRAGRDLRRVLAHADGEVFRSNEETLNAASLSDMQDYIELTLPRIDGGDSVALVVRMRNSLLNTSVFYDYMLAAPGARSVDWMATDLERIDRTAELGRWYASRFGLRIAVFTDGRYEPVTKLSDFGPIAWRDVAAVIPAPRGDTVRVRLSFLADQWRIDRVAVATRVRRLATTVVPLAAVISRAGAEMQALADLRAADERYLQTLPRDRFTAEFHVGAGTGESLRTFFLVSQGYYTEWVRGSWMTGMRDTATFRPSDETLLRAVRSWTAERDSMEQRFYRTRVPAK